MIIEDKYKDKRLLKKFMKEFFPYREFKKAGLFTKDMRNDYEAQADRICKYIGIDNIYAYNSQTIACHLSEVEPKGNFVTVIKSIYED